MTVISQPPYSPNLALADSHLSTAEKSSTSEIQYQGHAYSFLW
jgi:hypothetical protein